MRARSVWRRTTSYLRTFGTELPSLPILRLGGLNSDPSSGTSSLLPLRWDDSASWTEIGGSLEGTVKDAYSVEIAWNAVKEVGEREGNARGILDALAEKTLAVVEDLPQRGYASVWHGMAKLEFLHPLLQQKLTQRAVGDGTEATFLLQFSPRHLLNVLYALAKLHRVAKQQRSLMSAAEAFPGEAAFSAHLLQESFNRLNECNEQDLVALTFASVVLELPPGAREYWMLAEEVDKDIHVERFSADELRQVAIHLSVGGKLDLWERTPRLVRKLLEPCLLNSLSPDQLTQVLRCLGGMEAKLEHGQELRPLLKKLIKKDVLPDVQSVGIHCIAQTLGRYKIADPEFWDVLSKHLQDRGFSFLSGRQISWVVQSVASAKYSSPALLNAVSCHFLQNPNRFKELDCIALSNLFFAIGTLKFRNRDFIFALCTAAAGETVATLFRPRQISNILYSLSQINFRHDVVVQSLLGCALKTLPDFDERPLAYLFHALSLDIFTGDGSQLLCLAEEVFRDGRLAVFSSEDLALAVAALGRSKLPIGHRLPAILSEVQKEHRCEQYTLRDVVRIVRALTELRHPLPVTLRERLFEQFSETTSLSNRAFLDYMHCLESIEQKLPELESRLRSVLTDERLMNFSKSDLSECIISVAILSSQLTSSLASLVEELLEWVIVQGSLSLLTNAAIYAALSVMGYNKRSRNRPVLYSLAVESTQAPRLSVYNEQQLTGIFYNLTLLKSLHRLAFEAVAEEMLKPTRLMRYGEGHVKKILKALAIGKHKNPLIVSSVLNAFLQPGIQLQPSTIASILLNLSFLNCWKRPYAPKLLEQISEHSDLGHYSMSDIATIVGVLGQQRYRDEAVMGLLTEQMTKERFRGATDIDLCRLTSGFVRLRFREEGIIALLLSELLRAERCQRYANGRVINLFRSFAEWEIVHPSQLAGLVDAVMQPQRSASFSSIQLLILLKTLHKLRLLQSDTAERLTTELTNSTERLQSLTVHELIELRLIASVRRRTDAVELIQAALDVKGQQAVLDAECTTA